MIVASGLAAGRSKWWLSTPFSSVSRTCCFTSVKFQLTTMVLPAAQRLYYLRATARFGLRRNVLPNQIKAQACE